MPERRPLHLRVVHSDCEKAFLTTRLAETPEKLRPWISVIAAHAAIDSLRRQGAYEARFGTDVDVDEIVPDPLDAPEGRRDLRDDAGGLREPAPQVPRGPTSLFASAT